MVIRAAFSEKVTFESKPEGGERASHLDTQGSFAKGKKQIQQQQNSKCKGPETAEIARLGASAQESNRAGDSDAGLSSQVQLLSMGF